MKELLNLQGGYPREMDYLLNLQSEMLTITNGLFAKLGADLVLSGCDVVDNGNGTVNIAAGLVYIAGEVLRFDGASNITSNGSKKFGKGAYSTSDSKVFGDGSPKDVYREAKAVIANATSSPVEVKIKTTLYGLRQYIQDCINASEKPGTIKEVYDLDGHFLENFDTTGLGVTIAWLDWAIDNGNNGTPGSVGKVTIAAGRYTDPVDGTVIDYVAGADVGERLHRLTPAETAKHAGLVNSVDVPRKKPGDGGGANVYYLLAPPGAATDAANRHNIMQESKVVYRVVKIR